METRKKFFKAGMLALMVACLPSLLMAQKEFRKWPKGCSPQEVGELVSQRFVAVPHPNFNGNPAPPNEITYPAMPGTLRDVWCYAAFSIVRLHTTFPCDSKSPYRFVYIAGAG